MALERPKYIKTGGDAREALMAGFARTARIASLTLGPQGGRVVLERSDDYPELTRDGFTAIRDLEDDDRFATLGTELLKASVKKTRDAVGDGSTTTALLAGAFAEAGLRLIAAGIDPPSVRRGFDGLTQEALSVLERQSGPVAGPAMLAQLAGIAADGDDEIAGLVAEAVERLGAEGVVSISYHQGMDTTIDYMSGMAFDHGLLSRNFLLKAGETEVKLDQPHLLMCQGELTEAAQVVPALEAARASGRSLLVLAQDVSDQALAVMLTNHREGTVRCAAAKGPESGIYRHAATDDVAVLTGGRMVGEETGLMPEKVDGTVLGSAKRAVVDGVSTTIFGGSGAAAAVERRTAQLRDAIGHERKSYDRGKLEARLARLVSGVANIRVGGVTETAWKARYKACENALNTARAASADGVVAGGGVALARVAFAIEHPAAGTANGALRRAFTRALQEPFRRIAGAAGREPSIALETLKAARAEIGFDARTGAFRPYLEAGVVDATRVTTTALTNAAVTAGQLLSTGCVVALARRPDAV